jgi:hypothetical protein
MDKEILSEQELELLNKVKNSGMFINDHVNATRMARALNTIEQLQAQNRVLVETIVFLRKWLEGPIDSSDFNKTPKQRIEEALSSQPEELLERYRLERGNTQNLANALERLKGIAYNPNQDTCRMVEEGRLADAKEWREAMKQANEALQAHKEKYGV